MFTGWTWKGQEKPVRRAVIEKGSVGSKTLTANWKQIPAPTKVKADLRTISGGYDDVKLTWEKSKGARGYNIYYKKTDEKEYTFAKSVRGNTFVQKNLEDGVKYKFKVVPYFKSGGKKYLSTTFRVVSATTLQKVTDVKVVKKGKLAKVSWLNIEGETGYQISVSNRKNETQKEPLTIQNAKVGYKKLEAEKGKRLFYKVRAYKNVGKTRVYGPWSEVIAFTK
jgi:mannan endo-1,4-beta-mannosidase